MVIGAGTAVAAHAAAVLPLPRCCGVMVAARSATWTCGCIMWLTVEQVGDLCAQHESLHLGRKTTTVVAPPEGNLQRAGHERPIPLSATSNFQSRPRDPLRARATPECQTQGGQHVCEVWSVTST